MAAGAIFVRAIRHLLRIRFPSGQVHIRNNDAELLEHTGAIFTAREHWFPIGATSAHRPGNQLHLHFQGPTLSRAGGIFRGRARREYQTGGPPNATCGSPPPPRRYHGQTVVINHSIVLSLHIFNPSYTISGKVRPHLLITPDLTLWLRWGGLDY